MLSCLSNWIGMQGCSASTSDSGVYVNDLPGVELKRLADLVNEDDTSVDDIWAKIRSNGLRKLYTDVTAEFAKRYRIKSIAKTIDLGRVVDTSSTTASGANYQGVIYELNDENAVYTGSNLKMLYVQTVKIYLSSAVNTTVKVFDLDTQEELYSLAVTGSSGWNTVSVNTEFDAYRIFICYDATTVTAVKLDTSKLIYNCHDCDGRLRGATATIASPYVVTEGDNSFGLSVVMSERCSFNKVVCNNKVNFTTTLLYAYGIAFVDEALRNTSLNRTTTSDRDSLQQLKLELLMKYNGGVMGDDNNRVTVEGELEQSIAGINLEEWDSCLECNSTVRSAYATV